MSAPLMMALARRLHHAARSGSAALTLVQQQCGGSLASQLSEGGQSAATSTSQGHSQQQPQQRHAHTVARSSIPSPPTLPATPTSRGLLRSGPSTARGCRSYAVSGISQISPLKLSEVMRIEELAGKSGQEVAQIWLAYHAGGNDKASAGRAGAVYSAEDWALLQERAKKSPMFVLPLAKPGGYVTLVTQQQLPVTLVTTLEEFQRYGAGAPASITITHYPELLDSAKVVLVRADIVNDKLINQAEARTVLELLRALYTDGEDYKMVLDFNHQPEAFSFDALLAKMGIKPALPEAPAAAAERKTPS